MTDVSPTVPVPSGAEPIAVLGLACRLPQAPDPAAFWRLLRAGSSAVTRLDPERRTGPASDGERGPRLSLPGGFLDRIDTFDASFFGLSRREAEAMDPRQRLTLELAWEALEDARIRPPALRGTPAGVFVGAMGDDYATLAARAGLDAIGPYTLTGTNRGIIANRASYLLGLRGPSISVDTGQSSALVAVQLAVESLRRGESSLALAGGVHLVAAAESTLAAGRLGALSPDGRCFTFDSRANGYVRGEGGGVVVLRRLSDALADGAPIRAVILGGAVNNDGGGPGLTVPDQAAQEDVIRRALADARTAPDDVAYVELHGTGTRAGDPVEARALAAVLGPARAGRPVAVGSVKTNVGHLEAAAGIAGLLKAILSVEAGELPASLNYLEPPPGLPLAELGLRVQTGLGAWPDGGGRRVAGVSSFGMGGTNCHLVVADWPGEPAPPAAVVAREATAGPHVLTVSGRGAAAARAQARRLRDHLAGAHGPTLADVARSLVTTRVTFEHRAAVVGSSRDELVAGLDAFADGLPSAGAVAGAALVPEGAPARPVMIFPGQGSQWAGMARELYASSPVFAARLDECAAVIDPLVGWSLVAVVRGDVAEIDGRPAMDRLEVIQPALFAVMVSLAALWRSVGVEPAAVVGHSQGELAAACVAGALSLEQAARAVVRRTHALGEIAGSGGLLSVPLGAADVTARLAAFDGRIVLAAVNGPSSTVVGGAPADLEAFAAACAADGLRARTVPIDYASHTPAVERVRETVLADLAEVAPRPAGVPFYSTVTGDRIDGSLLDADYWYRNLREPVRMETAIRALLAAGHRLFVEVSPHPVLVVGVTETIDAVADETHAARAAVDAAADHETAGDTLSGDTLSGDTLSGETASGDTALAGVGDAVALGTLRRGDGSWRAFLTSVARVWTRGGAVDWAPVWAAVGGAAARDVSLPTYAFQRERYWLAGSDQVGGAGAVAGGHDLGAE
ncbi:type I polyketide synthase, partial [Pseudofrankia sp. BMG5.36]|uniref:type I polyketide synthase n=3 Tax=unclassified Pseudofrankia TaxID=2994372 RepID=UPI000B166A91